MGYHISIISDNQVVFGMPLIGKQIELGRQQPGEPEPFQTITTPEGTRLIVAATTELAVSRRQLRVEVREANRIELTNLSTSATLQLKGRPTLGPGQQTTIELPCSVTMGPRLFITFSEEGTSTDLKELPEATILPGQQHLGERGALDVLPLIRTRAPEPLVRALQTIMDVYLSARNEEELFSSAMEGALALIGFDNVRILRKHTGIWKEVTTRSAVHFKHHPTTPSQQVLQSVEEKKRTFWDTNLDHAGSASLTHVNAVIGAPILDETGNVIGILYADRHRSLTPDSSKEISALDARLMELLACGIASGLARLKQQQRADQMRLQFEQFFTPELAAELEQNPGLLEGQDAEVSLLFCDIRGFSRISERIGATETFHWIHNMMDILSDCVLTNGGVLVDYIGDELMAMWGAPRPQSNHATLACRAALAMQSTLPEINQRWEAQLGERIELSIGINSGTVKVGNAGSSRKFKYSPLGTAVNVASRVVGATRHLNTNLLITGSTSQQLSDDLLRRKLCDARVFNVDEPIELLELVADRQWEDLFHDYEQARQAFEKGEFRTAAHLTARLLEQYPEDGPSLVLLSRAVQALVDGPGADHPVWQLTSK